MKTKLFSTLCAIIMLSGLFASANAQSYDKAIGLNLGYPLGVNYKQFINRTGALDFTFGYQDGGVMLTAVFQHHVNLIDNLNLYFGGGVNIGGVHLGNVHSHHGGSFSLGIDPTVGFEYRFARTPIVVAVDYTPQINIISHMNFGVAAFKLRFVL